MEQRLFSRGSVLHRPFRMMAGLLDKLGHAGRLAVFCLAVLSLAPAAVAQDVTFNKTRYSSVKQPKEQYVALTVTDSKILIKGTQTNGIDMEIPFASIDSMSYEIAARHRVAESLIVGGPIMAATKTKSHWLDVEYHEGDAKQSVILRLDKSEYESVIKTLEAKTGKHIPVFDSKNSPLNPTAGSKDMDEVIPFQIDAVAAAVKPAMESVGCKVTHATSKQIECKREWGEGMDTERTGSGGERVTAKLDVKRGQTRVRIATEKGVRGRLVKKNWSTPIYNEMMKSLEKPPDSPTASATSWVSISGT